MAKLHNLKFLLENTQRILAHHDEITKAKGEHFNLFSVLKIEARENNTHSAFLTELLNPKGSHLQGKTFLELFLRIIQKEIDENQAEPGDGQASPERALLENFNSKHTKVIPEKHIGARNDKEKEGGRIDIYIKNGKHLLCIENKIYAVDQNAQIQRYCNHSPETNTVLYLTLNGNEPHESSKGTLEAGKDYFLISYRKHIIDWLELCLKEVPNLTSVRESINQYILLIKKLTNTLNMQQEKELEEQMINYFEESRFISDNFEKIVNNLKKQFREDVKKALNSRLDSTIYSVKDGFDIDKNYSQLWIVLKDHPNSKIKFGLEPFSGKGHGNGYLFVGLIDQNEHNLLGSIPPENRLNGWWNHTRAIKTDANNEIKVNDNYTLKKLCKPKSEEYARLIEIIVEQTEGFICDYEDDLFKVLMEKRVEVL